MAFLRVGSGGGKSPYLIKQGVEQGNNVITGMAIGWSSWQNTRVAPVRTDESGYVHFTQDRNRGLGCAVVTPAIDVTDLTYIYIDVDNQSANDQTGFYLGVTPYPVDGFTFSAVIGTTVLGRQTFALDVSNLSGSYYVVLQLHGGTSSNPKVPYMDIYNIWTE